MASLGYPGFVYRRTRQRLNPAEALLRTLKSAELDARLVEALVWVAVTYADLDWDWVVRQAKVEDLQNRLGFLVTLARQVAEQKGHAEAVAALTRAEQALEYSRLQREDAFRASMTEAERRWLRQHRSPEAMHWNVLTNLSASELARRFEARYLHEPWQSMLVALDRALTQDIELHCMGGFVLNERYGLVRPTADVDVIESLGTDKVRSLISPDAEARSTSGIACTSTS
ncbi:MAG: hypothetical protein AB7N65_27835 [Vicinamibacterales bacterium]